MKEKEELFLQLPSCMCCGHNMHVIDDEETEGELGLKGIMTLFCPNCGNILSIIDYPAVKRGPLFLDPIKSTEETGRSLCLWSKKNERKLAMRAN